MSKKIKKAFVVLLSVLTGGILGLLIVHFVINPEESIHHDVPSYYKLSLVPLVLFALWLTIGIHELGHLLAGLSQRFRFRFISVGPTMLEKEQEKIKFKWNTNFNSYGGIVLCLPTDQVNLSKRFAYFLAGGPIASIIWGAISFALLYYLNFDRSQFSAYALDIFLVLSCVTSFLIAFFTLLPMRSNGFHSDGGRLLSLLSGGPKAHLEATLLQYIAMASAGIRPSHQDPNPLLTAFNHPDNSPIKLYFHAMLYAHFLDNHNLSEAEQHLDAYTKGIEDIPKGYRASIWLENAWFTARFKKDGTRAREYYEKEKFGVIIPKSLIFRADAAIALAEGNYDLAISKAEDAMRELPNNIDKGAAIAEKDWLEDLIQDARQQKIGETLKSTTIGSINK